MKRCVDRVAAQLIKMRDQHRLVWAVKDSNEGACVTFEQALRITNERHADVIKKLEDK
ncbi:hypothetical protein [Sodalis sp.]|uniref:hypothetical protein n=1 Tax=Sodalis sp. (in: enterobacteria) TaxID=1898979 RepID=UPI0038731866